MGKYSPLKDFLISQSHDRIPMTFKQIEKVLDLHLPASKQYPAWWSNNPSNNPMTREWLEAGFETEAVNTAGEKLVFRRMKRTSPDNLVASISENGRKPGERRPLHPGIGFMKGLIRIEPGFDVSGPFTDESWENGYLGDDHLPDGKVRARQK